MIGGAGVARGYLGRPELTGQRFIRDPFQSDNTDGSIVLETSRGILRTVMLKSWVEWIISQNSRPPDRLGEIEAVLNEHPAVRESVVVAREAANGDKQLAAYLSRAKDKTQPAPVASIHSGQNADHMVPHSSSS